MQGSGRQPGSPALTLPHSPRVPSPHLPTLLPLVQLCALHLSPASWVPYAPTGSSVSLPPTHAQPWSWLC